LSYTEAFNATFAIDPHVLDERGARQLCSGLAARGIDVPDSLNGDALLDLALATVIVPDWPRDTAVFLHGYPVTQSALARIRPGSPAVAARFEVFLNGIELANGFHELGDAIEQRARFIADLSRRRSLGLPEPPIDLAFLAALEQGLPDCAGVALGIDRLIAVLTGADNLAAVLSLPHLKKGSGNWVSDT
jgi:lysyl-tRNA synthetase class 2